MKQIFCIVPIFFIFFSTTRAESLAHSGMAEELTLASALPGQPSARKAGYGSPWPGAGVFLRLGAGIAPLHRSLQPGMTPRAMPADIFVEAGKSGSRLSYALAYNNFGAWQEPLYRLSSSHLSLQLHFNLKQSRNLRFYSFAGISHWRAALQLRPYPGIVNYEYKVEEQQGIGVTGGVGAGWQVSRNLELGSRATVQAGQGGFLAGGFDPQTVQAGSLQMSVYLAWTFNFGKPGIQCPVFMGK